MHVTPHSFEHSIFAIGETVATNMLYDALHLSPTFIGSVVRINSHNECGYVLEVEDTENNMHMISECLLEPYEGDHKIPDARRSP